MNFKYEHLPNLCYWCGRLSLHDKDCPNRLKKRGTDKDKEKQYGSWLWASAPNPLGRTIIRVAWFDEELDEQGSEMDTTKGGTEGQVGANGANEPETCSTSPSVATMIVIELDGEELGTKECVFVEALISEDFREPSEAGLMLTPPVRVVPHYQNIVIRDGPNQEFQEQVDSIDRELAKFDNDKGGVLKGNESLLPSEGLKMASSAQFLKSFFVPSGLTSGFAMGSKVGSSRVRFSKHVHKQKHQREPKAVRESMLMKRVNRDSDEEMEEVEGSHKRRAVYGIDESVVANDQSCRQQ